MEIKNNGREAIPPRVFGVRLKPGVNNVVLDTTALNEMQKCIMRAMVRAKQLEIPELDTVAIEPSNPNSKIEKAVAEAYPAPVEEKTEEVVNEPIGQPEKRSGKSRKN